MDYLIPLFKTIHIIGFVSWFAGLFYLWRMFVYYAEAGIKPVGEREVLMREYGLMQKRVYKIICNPAMMITWTCGLAMTLLNSGYWQMGWFHVKFAILILLTVYHLWCKRIIIKLEKGKLVTLKVQLTKIQNNQPISINQLNA